MINKPYSFFSKLLPHLFFLAPFLSSNQSIFAQEKPTMYYKHAEAASGMSRFAKVLLRLIANKNRMTRTLAEANFHSEAAKIPRNLYKKFDIESQEIDGRTVFTLAPKGKPSATTLLYLHGGAYIYNIRQEHWSLIEALLEKTNARIVVPDYPLLPENSVDEAMFFMEKLYSSLLLNTKSEEIIFMGDSAGGGFALAFAQKLESKGAPQPAQIVLISPWLDISTSNPAMRTIEKKDPMLNIDGLQAVGKLWAKGYDTKNYLVSPMYGNMQGLGKISVFIGGCDILIADAAQFKTALQQQNIAFNYFEYPEMFHVWLAAPFLPESKIAIQQIADLVAHKVQ